MPVTFLFDGPEAGVALLLAHGAGAPMDSASMNALAAALAGAGFRVARFEFAYMAARRSGSRRPPPKAETLIPEYLAAVHALGAGGPLIIGGKSMGGRVASMVADGLFAKGAVAGLLCIGYPFHPMGKPDVLRTAHLVHLQTPTLIAQGTRDALGARDEVAGYVLSPNIGMLWLEDGDHDLTPRKSVSGFSPQDHRNTLAARAADWARRIDLR
jgi:predicted alpha/beta-hydrolase family hydrolase